MNPAAAPIDSPPPIPVELAKSTRPAAPKNAFGCPRDFQDNRFVYMVVSSRARGLSVGVNLNPDKQCNFNRVHCEVDRSKPATENTLDVEVMIAELQKTLDFIHSGRIRRHPRYMNLPDQLLQVRDVALSGDGEPTLSDKFLEAVRAVIHVRARGIFPFFKIVLITNAAGLDREPVQEGLKLLSTSDEIWAKLDAGTQIYLDRVNRGEANLEKTLANILKVVRQRPVIIQSLFPMIDGREAFDAEIAEYIQRLKELQESGAQISLVQIYSAARPMAHAECGHLPLRSLSRIARSIRSATGIKAEVF